MKPAAAVGWMLVLLAPAAGAQEPAGPAPVLAFGLAPSAVAIYDASLVSSKDGKDAIGTPSPLTVYGHDLRDDGQYLPVSPYKEDLPRILGLRLPPSAGAPDFRIDLREATDVAAKGTIGTTAIDEAKAELLATWEFSSRGVPAKEDKFEVKDGKCEAKIVFDRAKRVVESSRVHIAYVLKKWGPARAAEKPVSLDQTWDFRVKDVKTPRYDGFQKDVGDAIDRGLHALRGFALPDGSYPAWYTLQAGPTALAALTLAECDVQRDDPLLSKMLAILTSRPPSGTYEHALELMALERAYTPVGEEAMLKSGALKKRVRNLPPDRRAWCEKLAAFLEGAAESPGSWGYPSAPNALLKFDSSNTQYGALGMRAASRLGIPVKDTTWFGLTRHFEVVRERNAPKESVALVHEGEPAARPGETATAPRALKPVEADGFLYSTRETQPWASMVCAGIGCLELARHELMAAKSPKWTPPVAADIEARIEGGWAWLDRHWGMDRNAEKISNDWFLYTLYSLERAGIFSRVKTVGGKDWYFEGAMQLIARQASDGSWAENGREKVPGTCFALLFLKRATAPLTGDDGSTPR